MEPELLENGLVGGISPETVERGLAACPEAKAVFVVSPTYYGLCSDLRAIGEICHRKGVMLLVDEAHGAHLSFSPRLPEGALAQGADLCSQSIHKVTGSLTQKLPSSSAGAAGGSASGGGVPSDGAEYQSFLSSYGFSGCSPL